MRQLFAPNRRATLVAATLVGALSAQPVLSGGNHHHSHGTIADDSRFSNNKPGASWPPQPRARSAETRYTPTPANAKTSNGTPDAAGVSTTTKQSLRTARQTATSKAVTNAHVRNLLGQRFAHIGTRPLELKWSGKARAGRAAQSRFEVTYFSHSNNQTVKVRVDDGAVEQISTTAAAITQPPLAQAEMDEAISLARRWWQHQGNDQVTQLAGFAIQTYQDNGSFHHSRMVYVSFHQSSEKLPELLTWVDLTDRQVVRARASQ